MRLTEERFVLLLRQIRENTVPEPCINFAFDGLNAKELAALTEALKFNHSRNVLNLSVNEMQIPECQIIGKFLETDTCIERIELSGCSLSSAGVQIILQALHNNKTLNTVDLRDNEINDELVPALRELLINNTSIKQINFMFNKFSEEAIKQIHGLTNDICLFVIETSDPAYKRKYREHKRRINLISKLKIAMQEILLQHNNKHRLEQSETVDVEVWEKIFQEYFQLSGSQKINIPLLFIMHEIMEGIIHANGVQNNYAPFQFIDFCLQDENLTTILLGQLLNLPHCNIRDDLLEEVGHTLFVRSEPGMHTLIDIINAHICFANTSGNSYNSKVLSLETYRILLNNGGLVNHIDFDLTKWKKYYLDLNGGEQISTVIKDLDNLISAQQKHLQACLKLEATNGTSISNTILIFSQRALKAKAQDELKVKLKMHI